MISLGFDDGKSGKDGFVVVIVVVPFSKVGDKEGKLLIVAVALGVRV